MKRSVFLGLAAAVICGMSGLAARASSITYSIADPNSAISGYTGPYGSVAVTLVDSTHATFDYVAATPKFFFVDGSSVDANINATSFTVSNLVGTNSVFAGPSDSPTLDSAGVVSTFGTFNLVVKEKDASTADWTSEVTFTVTNTSGTWASPSDVLKLNDQNYYVAAHIAVYTGTGTPTSSSSAAVTGYAGDKGTPILTSAVPLPAAVWSGMAMLGGLGAFAKLRKRSKLA